ncbi:MAG: PspA/IM30 family protein [Proteobacteria bacterium]|nr:PspA/IM30 family protein [Pseudomonadota bacterium]
MTSPFRRWTASLVSRVDWMVTQVENHEALVDAAIRDVRRAAARAKVQLGRVRQDGQRLRERLAQEEEAVIQWRERAQRSANENETRALECLRRSKRAGRRVKELRSRQAQHDQTEKQLAQDVSAVEERLGALIEQRNLMRTRQSRADALSSVRGCHAQLVGDLDEVFDRWETRVTEAEFEGGCALENDSLEEEFLSAEEEDELRAELDELRDGN